MLSVIVTYTVQDGFAETNAANIRAVMAELRERNDPAIRYHAYRKEDGVTFVHFAMFADQEAADRVPSLESFQRFQKALRESSPVSKPTSVWLDVVGTSYECF